jgi:pre-mRNA-processing factor 39
MYAVEVADDINMMTPSSSIAQEETQAVITVAVNAASEAAAAMKEQLANDPFDFSTWTELLKLLEKDDSRPVEDICSTYDEFLAVFPLCFGFWNKYADAVKRLLAGKDDVHSLVCAIYERGTVACYHSVEMWIKYIDYLEFSNSPSDERRSVLQRAMAAIEGDPTANIVWDKAMKFEYALFNFAEVTNIYKRLLANGCCGCVSQTKAGYPFQATSYMDKYLDEFKGYAALQPLLTLASEDKINELKSKVSPVKASNPENEESELKSEDEVTEEVRGMILAEVEEMSNRTKERLSSRAQFESLITKSYFHVKPLHSIINGKFDDKELANWREYLDYEKKNGNAKSVEKLFERCLIPLANYSEFWIRYSQWAETEKSVKDGIVIIEKATSVFLKRRADVHMHRALLLEVLGDVDGTRATFQHILTSIAPGHLETMIKIANFERRQGNNATVVKAYEDAISCGGDSTRPFLSMQLARFQEKSMQDLEAARSTYAAAVGAVRSNRSLWLGYIQFEFSQPQKDFYERVLAIFDDALNNPGAMSEEDQKDLWTRKLDLIEDYAPNVSNLLKAERAFEEWQSRYLLACCGQTASE